MFSTIIIDDEQHCINQVKTLLIPYGATVEIIATCRSFDEAIDALSNSKPDFIFLDVQLGEKTGFDLLKALPHIDFEVVFTTAYNKYAVEAFRFSAIDFLLKPIDEDSFAQAMHKLTEKHSLKNLSARFDHLLQNLDGRRKDSKTIAIPTTDGFSFLPISEIVRCQSDINYTHIYSIGGQKITVAKTLKHFDTLLSGYEFFRVHNSHLINLRHVKKYQKGKGGIVTLADGSEIEVSVRRKDLFLQVLNNTQIFL